MLPTSSIGTLLSNSCSLRFTLNSYACSVPYLVSLLIDIVEYLLEFSCLITAHQFYAAVKCAPKGLRAVHLPDDDCSPSRKSLEVMKNTTTNGTQCVVPNGLRYWY